MISGVDWDPKNLDNDHEKLDYIHDPLPDIFDCDKPFNTYGVYCFGICATFDKYREHKHHEICITHKSTTVSHRSILTFGFSPDTWYKCLSPLGGEKKINHPNPSNFDPSLWFE
jgi:hypothetical protein